MNSFTDSSTDGLLEVYGLWYRPLWHQTWVYLAVAFFLCLIAACFFYRYCFKVKKLSCDREALQELHRLRSQTYSSERGAHEAYFKLTMIIKNYLMARYGVALNDKTDIQIVSMLDGIVSQNVLSLMKEFFDRSFQIKFAYDAVSETTLIADIDMLQKIIVEMSTQAETLGKS